MVKEIYIKSPADPSYQIYVITNLKNGKKYVGSHISTGRKDYMGSGKLIMKALQKYGKENFKKEILERCSLTDVSIKEKNYILLLNTLIPSGYNIHPDGGSNFKGSSGLKHTEETKNKMSNVRKQQFKDGVLDLSGEHNPMFDKKHREDSKKLIGLKSSMREISEEGRSNLKNAMAGSNNPMFDKKHSEESIQKIREKLLGRPLSKENIRKKREKFKCEYCSMVTNKSNLTRYHNDNCKHKK